MHDVLFHVLHFFQTSHAHQDRIWPTSPGVVPRLAILDRVQLLYNPVPPSLRRLRFFQYMGGQVDLVSGYFVSQIHQTPRSSTSRICSRSLTDFGVDTLPTLGSLHPAGNVWTVREEACSLPIPLASGVTQPVEHIMPALQTYHTRRESCDA